MTYNSRLDPTRQMSPQDDALEQSETVLLLAHSASACQMASNPQDQVGPISSPWGGPRCNSLD